MTRKTGNKGGKVGNRPLFQRIALAVMAVLTVMALTPLTACGGGGGSSTDIDPGYDTVEYGGLKIPADMVEGNVLVKEYQEVVLIIGNTANQPAPTISDNVAGYLTAAWLGGAKETRIISAAGSVEHKESVGEFGKRIGIDHNETRNQQAQKSDLADLEAFINVDPAKDHLDFVGAIKTATGYLRGKDGDKLLIVIGSGLNDFGHLNFAAYPETINEAPTDAVAHLVASGSGLSSTSLEGVDVVLSRIGCVSGEQRALEPDGDVDSKENLEKIYVAAVEALGGTVAYLDKTEPDPDHRDSVVTSNTVSPTYFVPHVPEGSKPEPLSEALHLGESTLGFIPDTAKFQDHDATVLKLTDLAKILKETRQSIRILGYQAFPPGSTVGDLPDSRALAVQELLINDLGVDPAQIVEARGDGAGPFANEYDENGKWSTELAQPNRVVVIAPA
jgi:hypothetical protein